MLVVFEYTVNGENEINHFRYEAFKLKKSYPKIKVELKKVCGSGFFWVKCYYDNKVKSIPIARLDLLVDFLQEYYKEMCWHTNFKEVR